MQTGPTGARGRGRCAPSLVAWYSIGSYDGSWRRSLRCNGRQSRYSGWLKQQFPTNRDMRYLRSDLSQSLCSDARRAEEGADGTATYKKADAPRQRRQGQEWTGTHTRYGLHSRATRRGRGSRRAGPLGRRPYLLTGASDTHIATLVERHSRFTMLVKLPRKDTTTVVAALAKHIRKLPEQLRPLSDVGPRQGDAPQRSHGCHQRAGFFLIRAVHGSAAATEHQRPAATVLSGGFGSLALLPDLPRLELRCGSINARERPWASKPLPINRLVCALRQRSPPKAERPAFARACSKRIARAC